MVDIAPSGCALAHVMSNGRRSDQLKELSALPRVLHAAAIPGRAQKQQINKS